jgi:hypothetical protein
MPEIQDLVPEGTLPACQRLKCRKFGEPWTPRKTVLVDGKMRFVMPTICPKCKSKLWNVPELKT